VWVGTTAGNNKLEVRSDSEFNIFGFSRATSPTATFSMGINAAQTETNFNWQTAAMRFTALGTVRGSVTSAGVWSLGAAPGAESLRVTPVASAVNYLNVVGRVTGQSPYVQSAGSDTNVGMEFFTKGTGSYLFYTNNGSPQFVVSHTASAVNYLQVTGGATGGLPTISALGSDADIGLILTAKGNGVNYIKSTIGTFFQGVAGANQFAVAHTASAVNYLQVTGQVTGGGPALSAQGSDTNINLDLSPKGDKSVRLLGGNGTGGISGPTSKVWASKIIMNQDQDTYSGLSVQNRWATATATIFEAAMGFNGTSAGYYPVYTIDGLGAQTFRAGAPAIEYGRMSSAGVWSLGGAPGAESLRVTPVASSISYVEVLGGTGDAARMFSTGSGTNVSFEYYTKGSNGHSFFTNGLFPTRAQQFFIAHTASAVNYLQVTGAATSGVPSISAQGTDANISLGYSSKGVAAHYFYTRGLTSLGFSITDVGSAVNYLQASGNSTGSAPTFTAVGSDTNIDIALTPKGTGVLSFGTYTAGIIAQAGYITIKDAGGTTRRLLVG
jgi:hypothetical protein